MNNHEILGLAVPTNEPDTAFNYLLASLDGLKEVAPISTFLFNFQKPWTDNQIKEAIRICESYGFEVRHTYNSYEITGKGKVPFNQIRGDACYLMPEAKFFMLMDDDFSFRGRSGSLAKSAGEQITDIVHYMLANPRCGFTLLKGNYYLKEVARYEVAPAISLENRYITDKGIILRNLGESGLVVPDEALSLVGSDEEKIACSWRLHEGYYPAVINHTRILHYENCNSKQVENAPVKGETMYQWNAESILEFNANKFIREHYYPEFVNRAWRPTQLVDHDYYASVGGPDILESEFRKSHTISYANRSNQVVISEILSMLEGGAL